MDDKQMFGSLVYQLRKKLNITLERVSKGLCTPSMLAKIEKGERYPDKLLRERLLERLGAAIDGYETYLNIEEYNEWLVRQSIVVSIEQGDVLKAEEQLANYLLEHDMRKTLVQQFYLIMQLQVMKHKGSSREEMFSVLEEAVRLTISVDEISEIDKLKLSIQEINLLLEYIYYGTSENKMESYKKLEAYVTASGFDHLSVGKIYPKIMYFMCRELLEDGKKMTMSKGKKILQLCEKGIASLKANKKMFYLWELLFVKRQTLESMYAVSKNAAQEKSEEIYAMLEEAMQQEQVIAKLYEEYGQRCEMADDCYLYCEPEVNCIADVVRTRRRMLGMSREELCHNLCSLKTLERLETKQSNAQPEVVRLLFQRLRLPVTQYHTEIITTNQSDNDLAQSMRRDIVEKNYKKAERKLNSLEQSLNMEEIVNVQFVERFRNVIAFRNGKLERTEYVDNMIGVLKYTLPLKAVMEKRELYMTSLEMGCLYNATLGMQDSDMRKGMYMRIFSEVYIPREKKEGFMAHFSAFNLLMTAYASYLGNMGQYDESDRISRLLLREGLKNRHQLELARNIYCIYWNYKKRLEFNLPADSEYDAKTNLWNSIILCRIAGQRKEQEFLEKVWTRINSQDSNTAI